MISLLQFKNYKGSLICSIFLFLLMRPYFTWHNILGNNLILVPMSLLLGLIFFNNSDLKRSKLFYFLFFVVLCASNTIIRGYNIVFFISILPFTLLPFGNKNFAKSVYENFLNIYCIILLISLCVWILNLFGAVPQLGTIAPLNNLKAYDYNVFPLLVTQSDSFRFYSVFDEPGVVGTVSAILLCCQKFNFNDKRTILLLISGLCSFSMFFYGLSILILLYRIIFIKKSLLKGAVIILILYISVMIVQSVPVLNELIGVRFQWDSETGKFAGDNRTSDYMVDYLMSLSGTKVFWFGVDNKNLFLEYVEGQSSIYMILILNGVLFCLMYLIFMISYGIAYKKSWSSFFIFMVVFLATVYQRPNLFNPEFIFLWTYLSRIDNFKIYTYECV